MPVPPGHHQDWWDSDMKSPTYNTLVTKDRMPSREAENLYNMGAVCDYAVNIAHNPSRTPGRRRRSSCTSPTTRRRRAASRSPEGSMVKKIRRLDPAKSPKITIGVNAAAPTGDAAGTSPGDATNNGGTGHRPRRRVAGRPDPASARHHHAELTASVLDTLAPSSRALDHR